MNTKKETVSIFRIAKAFEKIYKGLNKEQISIIEQQEMVKVVPSNKTEVHIGVGYEDEGNSIGLSIYVSNPKKSPNPQKVRFDKLMFEYLLKSDVERLTNVMECINLMERKGKNSYTIDGIPVFYSEDLGDYYLHLRIKKEL